MTQAQIAQSPELYARLKLATTAPGDSYWSIGELRRRKFEREAKDNWSWADAMAAPDTAFIDYARPMFTDYGWLVA